MKKIIPLVCLAILVALLIFNNFVQSSPSDEWWDAEWHYRVKIEVDSSLYSRTDWPIEYEVNFTELLEDAGAAGTFDENSTRLFEYNSTGSLLYNVSVQFDKRKDYDASSNAIGTLVFLLNDSTPANTKRYFYLYFDIVENGAKTEPSYPTDLEFSPLSGGEFNVNNSILQWYVDTMRAYNTSGIYKVKGSKVIFDAASDETTAEYIQYTNGTYNFSFDFRNNATFEYIGPVRIVVTQKGNETLWDQTDNQTGQGQMIKKYIFYSNNEWIRIIQNFTNIDNVTIQRSSTPSGALALEVGREFGSNYATEINITEDPGSWAWARNQYGDYHVAVLNLNESVSNFTAWNATSWGRIGLNLTQTSISPNSSIVEESILHFNDSQATLEQMEYLKQRLFNPVIIQEQAPEVWTVYIIPSVEHNVYNREEDVLIAGNISYTDPYNLTTYMNATFDQTGETIILNNQENGTFSNYYNLTNTSSLGVWNATFKAYDSKGYLLNQSWITFDVTSQLNVNQTILNPYGLIGRVVEAIIHTRNYRDEYYIINASLSCVYDSQSITNITNHNNGTHSLNFTAPLYTDNFILNCTASKDGNIGYDEDPFSTEEETTNVSIIAIPTNFTADNITWYQNQNFSFTVNVTNLANATSFNTNVTLDLPSGWSTDPDSEECNNIPIGGFCTKDFNLTVSEGTAPGNYLVNVTVEWENLDGSNSSNTTSINVTVESNYLLDVLEDPVSGFVPPGPESVLNNFTVMSTGNDVLLDVNYTISGLDEFNFTFIPQNTPSLDAGSNQSVQINITVPGDYPTGTYYGTLNVTSGNNGWKNVTLEVTVSGTNVSIITIPTNFTADNITWYQNQTFNFTANATNIGNVTAYDTNISITIPTGWYIDSDFEQCGNLGASLNCTRNFSVTIPNQTTPGNYSINVSVEWLDKGIGVKTNFTLLNVTVEPNPLIDVPETLVEANTPHGEETILGNFTVQSTGNIPIENVTFDLSGFPAEFNVTFIPSNISSLDAGLNQSIQINVSIPAGYSSGIYNGSLNVTTDNNGWDNLTLRATVPLNRTWAMDPLSCIKTQSPDNGTVCEVTITNIGNEIIDFNITPSVNGFTWVNETNFTIQEQDSHTFKVLYDVTGQAKVWYNYTYVVNATQSESNPDTRYLNISLDPFVKPQMDIGVIPNQTEQTGSVTIYANVTILAETEDVDWVVVNVTDPDNRTFNASMDLFYKIGKFSKWSKTFPGSWGNSTLKGNYTYVVSTQDTAGTNNTVEGWFWIYTKVDLTFQPGQDTYYQGSTGSAIIRVIDMAGTPLQGAEVNISLRDPNGIKLYFFTGETYTTDSNGYTDQVLFMIPSDATVGNYTFQGNGSYYDPLSNQYLDFSSTETFQVIGGGETFTGKILTPHVVYVNNTFSIATVFLDSYKNFADPDDFNITIYYMEGYSPQIAQTITMSQFTKQSTGYYTFMEDADTFSYTGNYMAVLKAIRTGVFTGDVDNFRIAQGGPYDVSIVTLEGTVPPGGTIHFTINVTNKGELDNFDVNVTYWIGDGSRYRRSRSINVLAGQTVSLENESFSIYPDESVGVKTIYVEATWDPQVPPAPAETTFQVAGEAPPPPPPPEKKEKKPPPTAAVAAPKLIEIVKYPGEVGVEMGWAKYISVDVKNIGANLLYNVYLDIEGIDSDWFAVTPALVSSLTLNKSATFTVRFSVPRTANPGEYKVKFVANSQQGKDEKNFTLHIFETKKELVEYELNRLKKDLAELEKDKDAAKAEGYYVTSVEKLIDEIKEDIEKAENYYESAQYTEALDVIYAARDKLDQARNELQRILSAAPITFPFWIIGIILVVIIALLLIFVKGARERVREMKRGVAYEIQAAAAAVRRKKADLEAERAKIQRMLMLLDKERVQGIISEKAYQELKKRNEEKLRKIEEQLR